MEIAYAFKCCCYNTLNYAFTDPDCAGAEGAWLGGGRGLACPRPGRKKLAGEMLFEALIPPHPVRSSPASGRSSSQKIFRSNLTSLEYRYKVMAMATINLIFKQGPWKSDPGPAEPQDHLKQRPPTCPPLHRSDLARKARRMSQVSLSVLLLLGLVVPGALSAKESPAARVERAFFASQARFHKNSNDPQAAWQFARACFDWADLADSSASRASIAERGMAACRQALEAAPKLAAAHYYLGLNLGQLARTKKLGALKLIDEMEAEFKAAIALDPSFDYAGAHRSLGLLYLDAPGWPTSIGNRSKARLHLRKAVELSPDYPDNLLSLLEAYLKWGDKNLVQPQIAQTEDVLQQARKTLTDEQWELSWEDWNRRWQRIKTKA